MKHFVLSVIFFSALLFCFLFVLGRNYHHTHIAQEYVDAIIDKHLLLEKTPSPRIILCGGSNIAFSVDSKRIQDSIGMPVINLGMHFALGVEFIINEVKFSAKPSDIVILSIEYFLDTKGNYDLQVLTAKNFPIANKYFKHNLVSDIKIFFDKELGVNLRNNISRFIPFKKNEGIRYRDSTWSRYSFNSYGDYVNHLNKIPLKTLASFGKFTYSRWEGITLINKFEEYAKANKIKVYFLYPSYCETDFNLNKDVIAKLDADLQHELKIPTLNKPADSVFPDSLFYDNVYHLNKPGREQRTNLLIKLLKEHI